MKKLIYFNAPDCPENMGQTQLVDDVYKFIFERPTELGGAKVVDNKLILSNGGYALIFDVPNDFQN